MNSEESNEDSRQKTNQAATNEHTAPADQEGLTARIGKENFCYLTTVGRVTGRPHEIEIWFAAQEHTLYMLSGGRGGSDWVKNLRKTPEVSVRVGSERLEGRARIIEDKDEDELARNLLVGKYERSSGGLSNWRRTALAVAVDLARTS